MKSTGIITLQWADSSYAFKSNEHIWTIPPSGWWTWLSVRVHQLNWIFQ